MPITERQAQILELAARGHSDKEIARELGLSVHTIRTHLQRLYATENFPNRAAAVGAWVALQAGDKAPSKPLSGLHRHVPVWRAAIAVGVVAALGLSVPLALAMIEPTPVARGVAVPSPPTGSPRTSSAEAVAQPSAGARPSPPPATPSPSTRTLPTPTNVPMQVLPANGELATVNQDRVAAGLPPLTWNQCLAAVATSQVQRVAAQGFVSSAGGPVADAGCHLGGLGSPAPAEVLNHWSGVNDAQVNSLITADPVQRAAVLGPYHYLGAAWAVAPSGVAFLALELA